MKRCFYTTILIFMLSTFVCLAFGDNIGGSAKEMSMGFLSETASSLANGLPRAGHVALTRSELYGSGVFYDHFLIEISVKNKIRIGLNYEAISDQDLIDNSGYGRNRVGLFSAIKINERAYANLKIGQENIKLKKQEVGKGFSCDLGVGYDLMQINGANIAIGLGVYNIVTRRTYQNRVETPPVNYGFNIATYTNKLTYIVEHKEESLSMGIEYKAFNDIAFRGGLKDGQLTIGCGLSRGKMNIDCAYWLANAGSVYRVSTGFSW